MEEVKKIAYVVDTNSLYRKLNEIKIFALSNTVVISGSVLREVDKHKTSGDPELEFMSREATRFIKANKDILLFDHRDYDAEKILGSEYSNEYPDNRILAAGVIHGGVISGDFNVELKAESFDVDFISFEQDGDYKEEVPYTGFTEVKMSQESFQEFYDNRLHLNEFDLLLNQYLIVYDKYTNEAIESFRWDGALYTPVIRKTLKSVQLGDFEAWDEYQACSIDAVMNHSIVRLSGSAGTAKTQIALSYGFQQLQAEKISKIIVFSNAVPTKGAMYHGLVKGDLTTKLMDSSIGNILASKLGSYAEVEALMITEKLIVLPASDIRGFDSSGMNALIIITEGQNWNDELMKLAIQRKGSDCKMIIEGDNKTQIDNRMYEGRRNGMRRLSEVFRGYHSYAEIELQNIYRSEEAKLAELITQY